MKILTRKERGMIWLAIGVIFLQLAGFSASSKDTLGALLDAAVAACFIIKVFKD